MGVVVKVTGLLLITALVAVTTEAACTGSPTMGSDAISQDVIAGEVVAVACDTPTPYINEGDGRVYLSQCLDGTAWSPNSDEGLTCSDTSPSGASYTFDECTGEPTLLDNAELMTETIGLPGGSIMGHFMKCTADYQWLSGASVQLSQCLDSNWTAIFDMCSDKCDVPRDCSEVSVLGFIENATYMVVPGGSSNDEAIMVYCWLDNDTDISWSETGWTMVARQGQLLAADTGNPDLASNSRYYIGIKYLKQLNLGLDQSDRPQTMQIMLSYSSESYYAEYQEVLIDTVTGDLKTVAKYMGNAGDALIHNLDIPYSDTQHWWYNTSITTATSNASKIGESGIAWPTLPDVLLDTVIVRIRPTAFDEAITCPPIEGIMDPSWTADMASVTLTGEPAQVKIMESLEVSFGRGEGAAINYTCFGSVNKEPISGYSFGFVPCLKQDDGTFAWSDQIQMPCEPSCPTNFVLAADKASCYHFSEAPEPNGVVGAALRCSELNSSLAFMRKGMGFDDVVDGTFYYTTHAMPSLSTATVHTDVIPLCNDTTGSICQETDDEQCVAMTKDSYQFQKCSDDTTHYACMWPPFCPTGFQSYEGMCYKAATFSGNAIAALEHCATLGAFLAYPLNTGTLKFLDGLVREMPPDGDVDGDGGATGDITPTDVVIGLNNAADNDWTLGGLYEVSSDVTDMATGPDPYYALHAAATSAEPLSLTSIPMSRNDFTKVLCQFPGVIKCNDDPPPPLANMIQVWDNNTDINTKISYRCSPGYFLNSNFSISEQKVECRGQLGGWSPALPKECVVLEVCNDTSLPKFAHMEPVFDSSTYMYLNGTVNYTCPEGMVTTPNITFQIATCMNDSMDTFAFTPMPSLCDICTLEPTVANGSTDWDPSTTWVVNDTVTATCNDSFLFDLLNSTQTLACTETGWEESLPCYAACVDPPPEAGSNMTRENLTDNAIGATLKYQCEPGLIFPMSVDYPDITSSMTITCGKNNTWEPEDFNLTMCASYCTGDPLGAPEGGNSSWDGISRTTGTQVNLSCPMDMQLGDGNQSKILTCEENGDWTDENPELFVCRLPVTEPPPALPSGMTVEGMPASGLLWEGIELNYTCPNNTMAASGMAYFTIVYNGTSWTEIDPEFICLNVCNAEPFTPVGKVKSNYTGINVEGEVINYYCENGRFSDYSSSYYSVCQNGEWSLTSLQSWCIETTPGPSTLPPIVLETDPPYEVSYDATAECHYANILDNMTDWEGNPAAYETPTGPFGFRSALRLQSKNQECVKTTEKCPGDAMDLETGFSIALWAKVIISADKFGENVTLTDDDKQYILSTGGADDCHTGIALYMKGDMLGGVVAVNGEVYAVEVNGAIPNDTWTNIGLRFEPPATLDSPSAIDDKTGGLELLVDMVKRAHVVFPQTCAADNGELDPSELMVGCHKTKDSEYGNFINGEFDELAVWPRKLYDNETLFFAGGYKYNLTEIKGYDFLKQLDRVDLGDVNQLLASVSISVSLATAPKEITDPSATPTAGSSSSTGSSSQATASSPTSTAAAATVTPVTEEVKETGVDMDIFEKLTDIKKMPKVITPDQCEKMMDISELASNLLQKDQSGKCKETPKDKKPLNVMVADNFEYWLDRVFKSVTFDNSSDPLDILKPTPNMLVQGSKRITERWQENKFYTLRKNLNDCNGRSDQAAASTTIFSDTRCAERSLSLTYTYYKTLQDCFPPVVNEALLYGRGGYRIESRVVAIRAAADIKLNVYGELDPSYPVCNPEEEVLKKNPNRFGLCHNTQDKPRLKRSLQFHSNVPLQEVKERFCAWWNPDIGDYGAWDTTDCIVLETNEHYTKCACAHFGRFTILAEKTEKREVPAEEIWLTITKYIGYIASFIALLIYIIVILVSGDLKDMFHLIGLNLAFSVFFGSIFMLVSDMDSIRDDRHTCTAIGTIIHICYLGVGAWMFVLGHSSFKAITSGVISGRLRAYFFLAWSVPMLSVGLTYLLFMQDLGLDPRCFISWENSAKYVFFGPQLVCCAVAFAFGTIVLCNLSTPALRKDNLIDDYGSFCQGASFVLIFFSITWLLGLFAYVRFYFKEPDFYPIFQVFNSWTGLAIFLFIGLASKRFRMVLTGQAKLRRQNLFGNAFGTPAVPVDDQEYLGSPEDQRSKSSSPPSSGRTSPSSPSDIDVIRPATSDGPLTRSQVAGRPGSRPNSGF